MNLPAMIFRHEPNSVGLAALTGLAEMAFAGTAGAKKVRLAERVKRNLHATSVTRGKSSCPRARMPTRTKEVEPWLNQRRRLN